jgi:hypothetical protein
MESIILGVRKTIDICHDMELHHKTISIVEYFALTFTSMPICSAVLRQICLLLGSSFVFHTSNISAICFVQCCNLQRHFCLEALSYTLKILFQDFLIYI